MFYFHFQLGESADVWSLGILLYTLLCGSFPFRAMTEKELYGKITKGIYTFPDHMSSSACDLVRKLLSLTATDRPLVEEILSDNWFINFNHSKSNYFSSFHYEKLNTGINNYNSNKKFESISIVERDFKEFKELNHVINTD
jgi:serine/threonine protein kinase